jgi:membrane-bound ClpP family serine protease
MNLRALEFPPLYLRIVCALTAMLLLTLAVLQPPLTAASMQQLQMPASNLLLRHALNPDTALLLIAAGWLLFCGEMIRPGLFLPGGIGVFLMTLGAYALGHIADRNPIDAIRLLHPVTIIGLLAACILTLLLLRVAWLARRSKFRLESEPAVPLTRPFTGHSTGYSSTVKSAE